LQRGFWEWVFLILDRYGVWLLRGTGVTLLVALTGTITGFVIGLLIGVVRTIPTESHGKGLTPGNVALRAVNFLLASYIEIFRGTPMIVQAMVIYYGLLEFFGVDLMTMTAAYIIVSINTGAYMAEIVRGGIDSIDPGQTEAAHAVGMTHVQTMLYVVLPQAIRNILPATGNEFIINIKDTSVLNVISVTELFFMTKSIKGAIFRTYEPFLICALIYLILTFSVSRILRLVEKKLDGPENYSILQSSTMPNARLTAKH
jgi:putative lysine transport system permease protein